jgi:glutamine synthetase adenylyltransferase
LRERLEQIIQQEEKRRKDDASYFNSIAEIYKQALEEEKQRKKLGFSTQFEFAVYARDIKHSCRRKHSKNTGRKLIESWSGFNITN